MKKAEMGRFFGNMFTITGKYVITYFYANKMELAVISESRTAVGMRRTPDGLPGKS